MLHEAYRSGVKKLLDISKIHSLGWHESIAIHTGVRDFAKNTFNEPDQRCKFDPEYYLPDQCLF